MEKGEGKVGGILEKDLYQKTFGAATHLFGDKTNLAYNPKDPAYVKQLVEVEKRMNYDVSKFKSEYGEVGCQIDSFNDLVKTKIPEMLANFVDQNMTDSQTAATIGFYNSKKDEQTFLSWNGHSIFFEKPTYRDNDKTSRPLYPKEAMERELSYSSNMYLDYTMTHPDGRKEVQNRVFIGSILVPVRSKLCNLYGKDDEFIEKRGEDISHPGGYLIVNGGKKCVMVQERFAMNKLYLYERKIKKKKEEEELSNKTSKKNELVIYAELRCPLRKPVGSSLVRIGYTENKNAGLQVIIPHVQKHLIPLNMLFKLLCLSNAEAINYIVRQDDPGTILSRLLTTLKNHNHKTREECAEYIGARMENMDDIKDFSKRAKKLNQAIFPNILPCSKKEGREKRLRILGMMTRMAILGDLGILPVEDRDSYSCKRMHTLGSMFLIQFYSSFKRLCTEMSSYAEKEINRHMDLKLQSILGNISKKSHNMTHISYSFEKAITKNAWLGGLPKGVGVAQAYEIHNSVASTSNLRKVYKTISSEAAVIIPPRKLHGTHANAVCCSGTPEGKKAGLIKELGTFGMITDGVSDMGKIVIDLLALPGFIRPLEIKINDGTDVLFEGEYLGKTMEPKELIARLKEFRRNGSLTWDTSIVYHAKRNTIDVYCDQGRLIRPVYPVTNGHMVLPENFKDYGITRLLSEGYIEFIDKQEDESYVIATKYEDFAENPDKYTHVEFDACALFGLNANLIPAADRNQAPRVTYAAAMSRQGIGIPTSNYITAFDKKHNIMRYVQKPLCQTMLMKEVKYTKFPAGVNAVVMIAPFDGANQEDSLVINKDAKDRGLFVVERVITLTCQLSRLDCGEEHFGLPEPGVYSSEIDPIRFEIDGVIRIGEKVKYGDALCYVLQERENITSCKPMNYKEKVVGIVTNVQLGVNGMGYTYTKIMVTQKMDMIDGNKLASLHGQKGICCRIEPQENLPFTKEGIIPDIIMNPLCMPSRMSIGQLVESITGKATAMSNSKDDPFKIFREDKLSVNVIKSIASDTTLSIKKEIRELLDILLDKDKSGVYYNLNEKEFEKLRGAKPKRLRALMRFLATVYSSYVTGIEVRGKMRTFPELAIKIKNFIELLNGEKSKKYNDLFPQDELNRRHADLTPFRKQDLQILSDELKRRGYDCLGEEMVMDGKTGKRIPCMVFIGVVYYQCLKHMIVDKNHTCKRADKTAFTRQPKEGRSGNGGLRFGIMESGAVTSCGAAWFLKDRLLEQSDSFDMWVCNTCGLPARVNNTQTIMECAVCRTSGVENLSKIKLPYGSKLLMQELFAMGIATRMMVTEKNIEEKK